MKRSCEALSIVGLVLLCAACASQEDAKPKTTVGQTTPAAKPSLVHPAPPASPVQEATQAQPTPAPARPAPDPAQAPSARPVEPDAGVRSATGTEDSKRARQCAKLLRTRGPYQLLVAVAAPNGPAAVRLQEKVLRDLPAASVLFHRTTEPYLVLGVEKPALEVLCKHPAVLRVERHTVAHPAGAGVE